VRLRSSVDQRITLRVPSAVEEVAVSDGEATVERGEQDDRLDADLIGNQPATIRVTLR